ncbi:MAG: sugar transferase [Minisyncoccia bacterium]
MNTYKGKRFLDLIIAIPLFLFMIFIFPVISILIILDDGLPVIIKSKRISGGKIFNMYKFRTMVKNAEELKKNLEDLNQRKDGPFFKIPNDPRVTKIGRFLRKIGLDELPQSWNIIKNEMSVVGPRPRFEYEIEQYPDEYKFLALARGGLTGLPQSSGDPLLSFKKTLELDKYYVEHQSLLLDIKIIFKTFLVVLREFIKKYYY